MFEYLLGTWHAKKKSKTLATVCICIHQHMRIDTEYRNTHKLCIYVRLLKLSEDILCVSVKKTGCS